MNIMLSPLLGRSLAARLVIGAVLIALSSFAIACNDAEVDAPEDPEIDATMEREVADDTIIDILMTDDRFSRYVVAIDSAGMISTLRENDPLTVFAPTNAAIDRLPAGTYDQLLAEHDRLREILEYHVLGSEARSTDIEDGDAVPSLDGRNVQFSVRDGELQVNGADVIEWDVEASNGVIHVIDAMLLPPED